MDEIDVLIKIVTFVCFVAFGLALWSAKKNTDRQKKQKQQDSQDKHGS